LLLAVEVTKIVTNGLLPICGEMLWVELLLLINEIFCVLALLESALAVCVAYRGLGTVEEEMAENIDWWAKRIVFPTYLLTLGIVYSLAGKLDDGYYGTTREMFEGLGVGMGFDPGPFLVSLSVVPLTGVLHFLSSRRRCEVKSATNTDEGESSAGDTPGSWI